MIGDIFSKLMGFKQRLDEARIYYRLQGNRPDAIGFEVAVPGEKWEIDFLEDGSVDVEIFKSDGTIYGPEKIEELFARFRD